MTIIKDIMKSLKDRLIGYIHFLTIRIKLSKGDTHPSLFKHTKEKQDD